MAKKKDAKLELKRYLQLVEDLKGKVSKNDLLDNSFSYTILNRCAREQGYINFNDFKLSNNIKIIHNKKLSLNDIIVSYENFYNQYHKFPTVEDIKNNESLYSRGTTTDILKENNMTLVDLCNLVSNNTCENDKYLRFISLDTIKYEEYRNDYIDICKKLNKPISVHKLSEYNLPTFPWFLEHCPNKDVKSYKDFYMWCGFKKNEDFTKDEVIKIIFDMKSKLNRPLMYNDFRNPKNGEIGITHIKKYFGTMNKMKKELGLEIIQEDMVAKHIDDFNIIKNDIINCCYKVFILYGRKLIQYSDINSLTSLDLDCNTINKYCKQNNTTMRKIIESNGYKLQTEGNGLVYDYDDGEKVKSSYELLFSNKLREYGFEYNKDYYRDIRYKTFILKCNNLLDCDYKIHIKDQTIYIELAGMLRDYEKKYKTPETIPSKSKRKYAEKLNQKENMFIKENLNYFILFPSDLKEDNLDFLFENKLNIQRKDLI